MNKKAIEKALDAALSSKKRKFDQSLDFIVTLKAVDIKKGEGKINETVELPNLVREAKVVLVADGETALKGKGKANLILSKDQLTSFKSKRAEVRKIANEYDFFTVEAPLMADFATAFGPILGGRGKMPNPKDVIPPHQDPVKIIQRLKNSIRIRTRAQPMVQVMIGKESMDKEKILENAEFTYDFIKNQMPQKEWNIRKAIIKTTMGQPEVVSDE